MKRKQNIFLFSENAEHSGNTSPQRIALNLVRLYVNKYIIDEDGQCEIQTVIPLMQRKYPYDINEKDISDQDAVLEQLDTLGYDYFLEEESHITHFIFTSVRYPFPGVGPWIEYWFNENAVKYQHLNPNYRFVFTSLTGSKGKISNKQEVKTAYKKSMTKSGRPLSNVPDNAIPVDIEIVDFEEKITAAQMPQPPSEGYYNVITNLNKLSYVNESFFYKQLTDSEIKNMKDDDLDTCKSLGLQPNLDNVFRRFSSRRHSVVIFSKPSCWFYGSKRLSMSNKPYDQRLEILGTMRPEPIRIPGRKGTALYYIERDTMPFILNDDEDLFDNYFKSEFGGHKYVAIMVTKFYNIVTMIYNIVTNFFGNRETDVDTAVKPPHKQ